jgi:hypothetical protein
MIDPQRQAYLEAMGFDVWASRPSASERDRLVLAGGQGSTLLLCDSESDCASLLAGDVARAVGGDPVWAWPDPEGRAECPRLAEAIGQRLFTRLVLFGEGLATRMFGQDIPDVLGSAAVQISTSLQELAVNGGAKKRFWQELSGSKPASLSREC